MSDPLIFAPGATPGLLCFGSPVRSSGDTPKVGIIVGTGSSLGLRVYWCMADHTEWVKPREVRLDLTDETGRNHAAKWLAKTEGLSVPEWATWRKTGRGLWTLRTPWRYGQTAGSPPIDAMERRYQFGGDVPEHAARRWPDLYRKQTFLSVFDTEDTRTLADGSRWADAVALSQVVLTRATVLAAKAAPALKGTMPDNRCDRCGVPTGITRMSMFNTDVLCPACLDEERGHPDYQHACDVENAAVHRGDYNFPGVGWPGPEGRVHR